MITISYGMSRSNVEAILKIEGFTFSSNYNKQYPIESDNVLRAILESNIIKLAFSPGETAPYVLSGNHSAHLPPIEQKVVSLVYKNAN